MGNMIKVGMADLKVCKCPDALTTLGLGSCVGVALYDPVLLGQRTGIFDFVTQVQILANPALSVECVESEIENHQRKRDVYSRTFQPAFQIKQKTHAKTLLCCYRVGY